MGILDRLSDPYRYWDYECRREPMLKQEQRKFTIKVKDIRNTTPGASTIVYANTISHAVELFLQAYLKNNRLTVEITEHNVTERKI